MKDISEKIFTSILEKWDKVLKSGPSKICERQPLKTLLKQTIFLQNKHVFSCEFCEISKNIFFTEHLLVTAPEGDLRHKVA